MKIVSASYLESQGYPWVYRTDLANIKPNAPAVVVNLDDRRGPGTHWVACKLFEHGSHTVAYYADPFGTTLGGFPPKELKASKVVANACVFQRPESQLCGYYAMAFCDALNLLASTEGQKDFETMLAASLIA